MSNAFYMLVGIPASGKSTYANDLADELRIKRPVVQISSDQIRKQLYGSESVQGDSSAVFELMRKQTVTGLKSGKDVVYDATNISAKRRRAFLKNLTNLHETKKICVIMATTYQKCIERNKARDRYVPEEVIKKMYLNWSTPSYHEGWDEIVVCYPKNARGSLGNPEDYPDKHIYYQQDNPFHKETLGEHLLKTREVLIAQNNIDKTDNLAYAALLHDCGKPFTKTFRNKKGELSDFAHYYQHANAGAYDALFYDYPQKTLDDILEISVLINYHMEPISWKENKELEQKRKKVLGDHIYRKLNMLHAADDAARKVQSCDE